LLAGKPIAFASNINIKKIVNDIAFCVGLVDKHVWFLYSLFFIQIMAFIIYRYKTLAKIFIIATVLIGIYCQFFASELIISSIFYYFSFFMFGQFDIFSKLKKIGKLKLISLVGGFLLIELLYLWNIDFLISLDIVFTIIKMTFGYFGIIGFVALVTLIFISKENIISYIGKNSFYIYLLHQPFIVSVSVAVSYSFFHNAFVSILISVICGTFIPLLYVHLKMKMKGLNNEKHS
jgi:peptidoglycan/LPS O-acetylase OafA/YrhL